MSVSACYVSCRAWLSRGISCFRFLLFSGVFLFYAASFLSAQSGNGGAESREGLRIGSISISGLKRTKLSAAEQPLLKFIGLETDTVDTEEVYAAIMAQGILEPLSVEIRGEVLAVEVREKWAIFPIPLVMGGSGGFAAGLCFFDANAFGLNDKLFLMGLYRSNGWMASAGYIHTPQLDGIPGWSGTGAFSREERHDRDQQNRDIRRFNLDTISFGGDLNFPLLEDTDILSALARFSFSNKSLTDTGDALNGPEEGLNLFGAGGGLSFSKSSWDGFLLSRESASLQYSFNRALEGPSFHSVRLRGIWEKPLVPGFRVNMRVGLVFEPDVPVLFESSPSASQTTILPRNFSARNYAGVSAGLEKYLFKVSAGILSLSFAYEAVYSSGSFLGDSLDHGVNGKLIFYLNRLAIPAVEVGAAYNVKENYPQVSFSLGMSF